jgi:hypothetical protein
MIDETNGALISTNSGSPQPSLTQLVVVEI